MDILFIKVLNMSLTASFLILVIFLIRLIFQRVPARFFCMLWGLAGLRLIFPWQWESSFSLMPSGKVVTPEILLSQSPAIDSGITAVDSAVNPLLYQAFSPSPGNSVNPLQIYSFAAAIVWLAGILVLAAAALFSYIRLRRQVAEAVPLDNGIWKCDAIPAPFILGIINPKIYVPFSDLTEESGVVAHEKAHLKRLDHITKPLAYGILILHWFNPLVWAAFRSFCRDVERACDEKVISGMTLSARKQYSASLLKFASKNNKAGYCPLAFGEVGVKERVDRVLRFQRPAKILICGGFVLLVCVCVFFMTEPVQCPKDLEEAVSQALLSETSHYADYEAKGEGHIIWRVEEDGDETRVYANTSVGEYGFIDDTFVEQSGSGAIPAILYFTNGEKYTFARIEYPEDGEDHISSIKEMFPALLEWKALHAGNAYGRLEKQKKAYAAAYLAKIGRNAEIGDYADLKTVDFTGISAAVLNSISERFPQYDLSHSKTEFLKDGVRCVQQIDVESKHRIVLKTYRQDNGKTIEQFIIEIDGDSCQVLAG